MSSVAFDQAQALCEAIDAALDKLDALDKDALSHAERLELLERRFAVLVAMAALCSACANAVVVNTGEKPPAAETTLSTSPVGRSDPNLVDALDYYVTTDGLKGYYFTTPSGKWNCAILPRTEVGCQAAAGTQRMGIPGEPDTVQTPDGEAVAPSAIAVGDEGQPGFIWLARPGFS